MSNISRQELRNLLSSGDTERVIEKLREIIFRRGEEAIHDEFTTLANRFNSNLKQRDLGLIESEKFLQINNNIIYSLSQLIQQIPENLLLISDNNEDEDEILFSNIMQESIPSLVEQGNIRYSISILSRLLNPLSENGKLIKKIESKFYTIQYKYGITVSNKRLSEREEEQKSVEEDLQKFIFQLRMPDFVYGWNRIYSEAIQGLGDEESYLDFDLGLFTPANEITIPENLVGDKEKENKFRRLLHCCQDATAVEDFSSAYEHCLQIRNELEPRSAQLYEYLLLTYFRKERVKGIVKQIITLEENNNALKHIILYANRYKQYQESRKCPSLTGEINLRDIANNLSEALRSYYNEIKNNQEIIDDKFLNKEISLKEYENKIEKNRNDIRKCIESGILISNYLKSSYIFLESVLGELCGAGKFDWIEIFVNDKDIWELKNINPKLDAINKVYEIQRFFSEKKRHKELEIREQVIKNLLLLLRYNYDKIKVEVTSTKNSNLSRSQDEYEEEFTKKTEKSSETLNKKNLQKRAYQKSIRSMIKCLNACKICYLIFDKEKRFLETAVRELSNEGVIDWFAFNQNSKLVSSQKVNDEYYDAFRELNLIFKAQNKVIREEEVLSSVKRNTYKKYIDKINRIYISIRYEKDKDKKNRLIFCVKNWWIAYKVYFETDPLDKCIKELSSKEIYSWFDIVENGLKINGGDLQLIHDIEEIFEELRKRKSKSEQNEFYETISRNLYEEKISSIYQNLRAGFNKHRIEVFKLIVKAKICYEKIHPLEEVKKFIYEELIGEKKFQWYDINESGLTSFWGTHINSQEAIDELQNLLEFLYDSPSYTHNEIKREIATKRCTMEISKYKEEINTIKSYNRSPEREITLQIIKRCRHCFKMYPNKRFLEIPIEEFSGKGRIKWFYKIWKFEIATMLSLDFYEEFEKERRLIRKMLKESEAQGEIYDEPLNPFPLYSFMGRRI